MVTTVLICALAIPFYAHVGYPSLLWLIGRGRRPARRATEPCSWPTVSITVPVYNEEATIAATLERLLKLDYPSEQRQILAVSDASTDRTDEIVRGYTTRGVELLRLPKRGGKTAAENAARHHLTGEIVVNTDASVEIHPRALKALIAALTDPDVGVASGRDVSMARVGAGANLGEARYVGYEMWVRDLETRLWGIVGASGCLYAIRKQLHMELVPDALSRDFAATLIAREHGYRAVSVPEAICYVPRAPSLRREYRRKVRTMTRGLETLWYKRHLMNPFRYHVFAWLLFSHKLCRWLAPWALIVSGTAVAALASAEAWARYLLGLGGAFAIAGGIGWLWPEGRRIPGLISAPAYFVAGSVAAIEAWIRALRGELNPLWEPTRRGLANVRDAPPT